MSATLEDKQTAISKISKLLNKNGRFVLSIDKNQNSILDLGNPKIKLFPDSAEEN